MKLRKSTLFTSTNSFEEAKAKAKSAGYSIVGKYEQPFGNFAGFVIYGKPKKYLTKEQVDSLFKRGGTKI
jgi:hypothetical protein